MTAFTSSGLPMTINRLGVGAYRVDLAAPHPAGGAPETYLVSAQANTDYQCLIGGWNKVANVLCYSRASGGAATDATYDILTVTQGRPGRRAAFALADQPTLPTYTPTAARSFTTGSGPITVTRAGTGQYSVHFPGLQKLAGHTETVVVSGFGSGFRSCNVLSWGNTATDFSANIQCSDINGGFVDSYFTILVLE